MDGFLKAVLQWNAVLSEFDGKTLQGPAVDPPSKRRIHGLQFCKDYKSLNRPGRGRKARASPLCLTFPVYDLHDEKKGETINSSLICELCLPGVFSVWSVG